MQTKAGEQKPHSLQKKAEEQKPMMQGETKQNSRQKQTNPGMQSHQSRFPWNVHWKTEKGKTKFPALLYQKVRGMRR